MKASRKFLESKYAPWALALIAIVFLTLPALFSSMSETLAASVTMEVYQQKDGKAFGRYTEIDVFDNPELDGQKIIAPGSGGSYVFAVYNNSESKELPYDLDIFTGNEDNIPVKASVRKNGEYVFGGPGRMLPFDALSFPDMRLAGKETDYYAFDWEWEFYVSDEDDMYDTALGFEGSSIYSLVICATGTMPEADAPTTGAGAEAIFGISAEDLFGLASDLSAAGAFLISKLAELAGLAGFAKVNPQTGQLAASPLGMAALIAAFAALALFVFIKRKKGGRNENKAEASGENI